MTLTPEQLRARAGKLTASRVRQVLHYDPKTGVFRWRIRPKNHAPVGSIAGTAWRNGRRTIMIDGHRHYASTLAWVHFYGEWPKGLMDHRNNDPGDDRILNIRPATRQQNRVNAGVSRNNLVGMKGVSKLPSGRFQARLAGRYLGSFDTAWKAHVAYFRAATNAFGEFARSS